MTALSLVVSVATSALVPATATTGTTSTHLSSYQTAKPGKCANRQQVTVMNNHIKHLSPRHRHGPRKQLKRFITLYSARHAAEPTRRDASGGADVFDQTKQRVEAIAR